MLGASQSTVSMNIGSVVRKLIGKRRLTPVQLAKLIGPELLGPLRKATETLPVWDDVLSDAKTGRIYFEIVAAQLSFSRTCFSGVVRIENTHCRRIHGTAATLRTPCPRRQPSNSITT